ncbi:MAG: D-alanyl-D-alanine carboxypeptidase/D-alanyl-D-alanine endopeptidase [Nakamurella sp.]
MRFHHKGLVAVAASGAMIFALAPAPATDAGGQVTIAAADTAQSQADLTSKLDNLLADPRYNGSQVGLEVRDATTGETLYDHNGNERLLPASNMKLFTSTAALHNLGADFRFHTDVDVTGKVRGGTLKGNLYLKGYGDPTALAADYATLAKQVKAAGIRRVDGNLVADSSYFDNVPLGSFWSWDDEPYYYSAVTSGLTVAPNTDYDAGNVIVDSRPGKRVGSPVKFTLVPQTSVLHFVNTATTGAAGSANTLDIERDHASNIVRLTGSVPLDDTGDQTWVTVPDPTSYAGDVFRRALTAAGVRVEGRNKNGTTPAADVHTVATHRSMTLGQILTPFLKLSNNMHAEALTKTLGAEATGTGSWGAGETVIKQWAQQEGVDTSTTRMVDGSGLSRGDNLTTDAITQLLVKVQSEPWFTQWYNALPIAGNPDRMVGGTLDHRMAGTPAANNLHGKTGSMTGVTALSGYLTDADGRKLVFSMLSNNYLSSPQSVEDAVAVTLASYTASGAAVPAVKPAPAAKSAMAGAKSTIPADQAESEWCALGKC